MLVAQVRKANGDLTVWESATAPLIEALFADAEANADAKISCISVTYEDDETVTFAQVP